MCGEIRLALAEVRRRTPLADLRGTPGGRCSGPSSMGPRQALLSLLLLLLTSRHLTSRHLTSRQLTSPHLTSPHLTSPHLTSPHLTSPHLTSPHLTSITLWARCWREVTGCETEDGLRDRGPAEGGRGACKGMEVMDGCREGGRATGGKGLHFRTEGDGLCKGGPSLTHAPQRTTETPIPLLLLLFQPPTLGGAQGSLVSSGAGVGDTSTCNRGSEGGLGGSIGLSAGNMDPGTHSPRCAWEWPNAVRIHGTPGATCLTRALCAVE